MAEQINTKYLILTFNVCNLGGGQLYVLRRAKYLRDKGIDVSIIVTFDNGNFPLENDFRGFPIHFIPELGKSSVRFSKHRVNNIIEDIEKIIGDRDELLIESHTLQTAEWGELIAYYCKGKHLIYPLAEPQVKRYIANPGKRIFYEKLKKGEFYGCSSRSLSKIFGEEIKDNRYVNIGYEDGELIDKCSPAINYSRVGDEYVITTITRLDKLYVVPLIKDTIQLAKKYSQTKFVLILAGGSKTPGREEYLFSNFNDEKIGQQNLHIVFTGYINKLGKDIFNMSDVFVGMGTASINAISQSCLTINIDPSNQDKPASGFFGVDTNNFAYSENGKSYSILEKLEETFLLSDDEKKKRQILGRKLFEDEFEVNSCFQKLDRAFENIEAPRNPNIFKVTWYYKIGINLILKLKDIYLFFLLKRWRK